MNVISILFFCLLSLLPAQETTERGHTIWIGPCGYSYYMTETDDGLPSLHGNTKTFEEAQEIINSQKDRDDELRRRLRVKHQWR